MTTISVSGLTIDQPGEDFIIEVFTAVQPAGWSFTIKTNAFNVLPEDMAGTVTEVYKGIANKAKRIVKPILNKEYIANLLKELDKVSAMASNAAIVWEAEVLRIPKNQKGFNNLIITAHGSESDLQLAHRYLCYQVCMHMRVQYKVKSRRKSKIIKLYIGDIECKASTGRKRKKKCTQKLENWQE